MNKQISAARQPVRISRGNRVIGGWSSTEVKERLAEGSLLLTDSFYDEGTSDWLPLSELREKQAAVKPEKVGNAFCYCGTRLPFQWCCGTGRNY